MYDLPIKYDLKLLDNQLVNWVLISETQLAKSTINNLIFHNRESIISFENNHIEFITNYFNSKKDDDHKYNYSDLENDTRNLFSNIKFYIDEFGFFYFKVGTKHDIYFKYNFYLSQSIRELKIKKVLGI